MGALDFIIEWLGWGKWIVAGLLVFAMIWAPFPMLFIRFIRWIMRTFWPSMENWSASANANENHVRLPIINPGTRWCTARSPQRKDDYYEVDMQEDRTISRVQLVCKGRDPLKYKIEIATDMELDNFREIGTYSKPISHEFNPPEKFRVIKFTIVDPEILPNNEWHSFCVYEVRFWESRLWGLKKCRIKSRNH